MTRIPPTRSTSLLMFPTIPRRHVHMVCLSCVMLTLGIPPAQVQLLAGNGLPRSAPESAGMDGRALSRIEPVVRQWLHRGEMAGCVVAVGHRGTLVYLKAFGHRQIKPKTVPMTTDTLFDLASLTKPIATATSVIRLVDQGRLRIHDKVTRYWPEFGANGKEHVTLLHLLTHQSGLTPDNSVKDYQEGIEEAQRRVAQLPLLSAAGEKFRYSDVGFITLGWLVERTSGKSLDRYVKDEIFEPLGMGDTGYVPDAELRRRAAANEKRDGHWMLGEVHDPRAFLLGGVAGHAGLFSTAEDLAIYAQMMLNGGSYRGRRILSPQAVRVMTRAYSVSSGFRGLGWDKQTGYSSNRGEWMTSSAFGHGGFTGTAIWIDPGLDLFVIFLSNRLHPDGKGTVNRLAGRIGTIAAGAVSDSRLSSSADPDVSDNAPYSNVLSGIDVLQQSEMGELKGKRVGLITNHTGIDRDGTATSTILHENEHTELVALFSPEHGIAGKLDVAGISDTTDPQTGLKVISLYGKTRKPTAEALKGIDALVFDIQDIGCRFYTYISTMGLAMEAAAENGVEFIVLDRPNPIGGLNIEGPLLDQGKESFVGYHPLPVRHGMTAGELARMFQKEKSLNLKLTVVPLRNWRRTMYWDRTGLYWVNPSPNMRSLNAALLYPGVGLLETTNLSVGRGTDTPFEILGAPWLNARKLAADLSRQDHHGLAFVPVRFRPDASKYENELCEGIQIVVTDRTRVHSVHLGLALAHWLRNEHAGQWELERFPRLLGNEQVFQLLKRGATVSEIETAYRSGLEKFRRRRQPFLMYP